MKKLTKRQKEILTMMNNDHELIYCKGGGWWIDDIKTNSKLVFSLLRGCLISLDSFSNVGIYEIYYINETGKESLETQIIKSII